MLTTLTKRHLLVNRIQSSPFQSFSIRRSSTKSNSQRTYQVIQYRVAGSSAGDSCDDDETKTGNKRARPDPKHVTIYRNDGSSSEWNVIEETRNRSLRPSKKFNGIPGMQQALYENVIQHFLPAQYPHSVADGYARFSLLAFSASVAGSSAMVLSTQTLLLAVGVVGNSAGNASVMAGALNWVLKDGIGQLGGVIFASKMGETKRFDSDPKRWRMLAALSLDAASLLEIVSPLIWSSWVLPVASLACVGKNIGYLTASASRAAIHQALAQTGNLADVTAKSGSQSMAAGLLGTALGIGLSTLLQHDTSNFIMGVCVLSAVHQGCNYASLKEVPLQHFNRHRLHLFLSSYMTTQSVLTPSQIASDEQYFPLIKHPDDTHSWLIIGSPVSSFCPDGISAFDSLVALFKDEAYLINLVGGTIHLVFLDHATGKDLVVGMYHAHFLHAKAIPNKSKEEDSLALITETYSDCKASAPGILDEMQKQGWNFSTDVTNIETSDAHRLCIRQ